MSSKFNLDHKEESASKIKTLGNVNQGFGSSDPSFHSKSPNVSNTSHDFLVDDQLHKSENDIKNTKKKINFEMEDRLIDETNKSIKNVKERWYTVLLEVLFPFFIAGFGMVAAGVVLDKVQHWELYKSINAIYTLIPALLGLKGNLEMTLASRLSTQTNMGMLCDKSSALNAILGNFALTQCQAIVVGFLASMGALVLELVGDGEIDYKNAIVLIVGSMSTASFASLALAGLMMCVIILSKKLKINPDNIATPIAASLGDLVTLTILSFFCTFLYYIKHFIWIHVFIFMLFIILIPVFAYYSYKNEFVKDALYNGWIPIILAMLISSTGGWIMGYAVDLYTDIAVFQPVVNGVGGNLVAIFASRLSTVLHQTSEIGVKAEWAPKKWYKYPFDTFFSKKNPESSSAIVLSLLALPGHIVFYLTITRIKMVNHEDSYNPATTTISFISFYLTMSTLQVIILFLVCYWLVHTAWSHNKNPDNISIPYLTAIGDLLGTAFLAICFHALYLAGNLGLKKHT